MTVFDLRLPAPLEALPTPALLVDHDLMARNISDMAARARAAGVRLRPHFKTSKCLAVAHAQLAAGAAGFTCATAAEVAALQGAGVGNLLWAHEPVGPAKVDFAVRAATRGGLTVAVDSVEIASPLSEAATAADVTVDYLVEVDTGHGRAGVLPEQVVPLARELARLPGLALRGVFTHEGHLSRHLGDRTQLEAVGRQVGETMVAVAMALAADGHPCPVVSVGSTPGATSAPEVAGVTEARAGTYVFYDANQVALGSAVAQQCALTVLTRVMRVRADGVVLVDAGVKAMSSDVFRAGNGFGVVAPDVEFMNANEEHGFLTGPGTDGLRVGNLLRIVPNHACGTVNMWSSMYVVEENIAVARWETTARH